MVESIIKLARYPNLSQNSPATGNSNVEAMNGILIKFPTSSWFFSSEFRGYNFDNL